MSHTPDPEPLTPAAAGFTMPPEWAPHAATRMAWPCRTELWGDLLEAAKADYAAMIHAVAAFEPVLVVCPPGQASEIRDACGTASAVEVLELPIDDSWTRDNGPIFVTNTAGEVAAIKFGFNAWGDRWHPHADDARLPERIAAHLGMRLFEAPMILEGGSITVDGDGTVLTTEQCLLNPNRNPGMPRGTVERHLRDYLGVSSVIWLPFGHETDSGPEGTDGHVDGIATFLAPGRVLLDVRADPASPEHASGRANLAALQAARDAHGRAIDIALFDPGAGVLVPYANHYVVNGGVIVPLGAGGPGSADD
ncbi:MAG: agmatine deiminase family protein, partial [Chloroflexi bacterium]|nr:agmatine deiminase family protein [Chloroflexota bacterium]